MANDLIKFKEEGDHITCEADGASVTGKHFVYVSGDKTSALISGSGLGAGLVTDAAPDKSNVYKAKQVGGGQAGFACLGVASFDAPSGALFTAIREGIVPVAAGASITAGQLLQTDSTGRVIPRVSGAPVGLAMRTQTTVDADCEVLLLVSGGAGDIGDIVAQSSPGHAAAANSAFTIADTDIDSTPDHASVEAAIKAGVDAAVGVNTTKLNALIDALVAAGVLT